MLERLRVALKQLVYEAGPTGFSLARALAKAELPVSVVASSMTPNRIAGIQMRYGSGLLNRHLRKSYTCNCPKVCG